MSTKLTQDEIASMSGIVCADFAADHLGGEVPGTTTFNNMVRALEMHSWCNTAEEAIRLKCARWARRNRKMYLAELDRRRNLKFGSRRAAR